MLLARCILSISSTKSTCCSLKENTAEWRHEAQIHALGATYFATSSSSSRKPSKSVFLGQNLNNRTLAFGLKHKKSSSNRRNGGGRMPLRVVAEKVVEFDLGTTNSAVAAGG
ncbi:heat shock [Datura stramonium]|uniref:Heat shock n=1 Tax=Datura stramonium TaxID=4076 RepID=A0ABS8UTI8_DATST|nr:heat shock [Datura stramonium]